MVKCSFAHMNCSVARALDILGEWWTMLILRDMMLFGGSRRFEQLREGLGISRNILTERLKRLVDEGLAEKLPVSDGAKRHEYRLTEKGWDLMPIMVAMSQWGHKWRADPENDIVDFVEVATGKPLPPVLVRDENGRALGPADILVVPTNAEGEQFLRQSMKESVDG